jgi:hypothetical protein
MTDFVPFENDVDGIVSQGQAASKIVGVLAAERRWSGEVITEPGVYAGLPLETYHSDCCDGPSISSSGLREIAPPHGCPMKYWDNSYLNPDRAEREQKEHFSLGHAVHTLLLGEDGFAEKYIVRPKVWSDWRTNAAKAWRDAQIKRGKIVLMPEHYEQIEGMANRVVNDRTFRDHLDGPVERSIIYQDRRTGVWVKSRPDCLPSDTVAADLKTTSDASDQACLRAITKFGYHQQMGLVSSAIEAVLGIKTTAHVLLFIETTRPYAYNIKPVDNQYIWYGQRQNRAALDIFAEAMRTKYWPTYFGSGTTASPSDWFEKSIENEPAIPAEAA